jgi:tetratricopeptide (TPR) repeat protein
VPPRQNERALALQEEIGRKLRAMELDAQSKEQMAAGDTRQALETLKAALELDPNNADAQVCAWWWLRTCAAHTRVRLSARGIRRRAVCYVGIVAPPVTEVCLLVPARRMR